MANLKNTTINDTGFLKLPAGTEAERPSSPVAGMVRYNTDDQIVEVYNGTKWGPLVELPIDAEGGTVSEVTIDGQDYKIHAFTSTGNSTFTVNSLGTLGGVDVLVVAGGGSGGRRLAGGGGAGGLVYQEQLEVARQNYTITVGAGGAPQGGENRGENGDNSSVFGLTAIGGGGGGGYTGSAYEPGKSGGSGGGGGSTTGSVAAGGAGTQPNSSSGGFGNDGGNGGGAYAAAGGGGAGSQGDDGVLGDPNAQGGGIGLDFSAEFTTSFGENGYFAGGGGGHQFDETSTPGAGGLGGGGNGGLSQNNPQPPGDAIPNTGGGGGGGGYYGDVESDTGAGGSGIVLIRYKI